MPEMKQDQTVSGVTSPAAPVDDLGPDPLRSLHKMSTTAGISSQEYVAINTAAVWTAALGVASLFALIDPILLVIPLAAVVFGFVALHQIKDSNGTETGRSWAWLGLLFAF